jgi:hypothetical protein
MITNMRNDKILSLEPLLLIYSPMDSFQCDMKYEESVFFGCAVFPRSAIKFSKSEIKIDNVFKTTKNSFWKIRIYYWHTAFYFCFFHNNRKWNWLLLFVIGYFPLLALCISLHFLRWLGSWFRRKFYSQEKWYLPITWESFRREHFLFPLSLSFTLFAGENAPHSVGMEHFSLIFTHLWSHRRILWCK